jgi:acetolactate synthase I/II/III large subunit
VRFVGARGEAGAVAMADAFARVAGGLGVAITSTGTAAANASGALLEALAAGTPLLHLTGQIDSAYLDRDQGALYEAPDQLGMLRAVSKAAFRVRSAPAALGIVKEAVRVALTPPAGPVSVEVPIDVLTARLSWPPDLEPLPVAPAPVDLGAIDALAERVARARRPLLWLGGGARHAGDAVRRLVDLGFGVVTSQQGRGVLPEDHPRTLGAINLHPAIESFYRTCDAIVVAGSRLRSNETATYRLELPRPLYRIDIDARRDGQAYASEFFVAGDAAQVLEALAARLGGQMRIDSAFARDLANARAKAEDAMRSGLGPYERLLDALQSVAGREFVWVRDVTIAASAFGDRLLKLFGPRDGVHAAGGGIGMGVPMAIGAALGASGRKVLALAGDGGIGVALGELATLAQEKANVTIVLMNDAGYGMIRNVQDAHYGGRRCYADLHTPDFERLAQSLGLAYARIATVDEALAKLQAAVGAPGPVLVEVDMRRVGAFREPFAG